MDLIKGKNRLNFNLKKIDKLRKKELRNPKRKPTSVKVFKCKEEIEEFMKRKNHEEKKETSQKVLDILTDEKLQNSPKKQKSCFSKSIEHDNKTLETNNDMCNIEKKDVSIENKKESENEKLNNIINKNITISRNDRQINEYKVKNHTTENKENVKKNNLLNLSNIFDKSKYINNSKRKLSTIDINKKFLHPKKKVEIIEPKDENSILEQQNLSEYKIKIYYEGKFLEITMSKEDNLNNFLTDVQKKLYKYNFTDYELLYKLKPIFNKNDKNLSEKKLNDIFNDNDSPSLILRKKENALNLNNINTSVTINNFPSYTDISNELNYFFQVETLESDFSVDYKENVCIVSFSLPAKAFALISFLNKLKKNNPIYKLLKIKLDYKLNVITDVAKNRKKLRKSIKLIISPPKLNTMENSNENNNYAFSLRNQNTKKIFNYFKLKSKINNNKQKMVSFSPQNVNEYKYFSKGGEDAPKVIVLDYKNKNKVEENTKKICNTVKAKKKKCLLSCNNLREENYIIKKSNLKKENNFKNENSNNIFSTINIKENKDKNNKSDEEDPFIAATKIEIKRKNSCFLAGNLSPRKKGKLQLQDIKKKKNNLDINNLLTKRKNSFTSL